MSTQRMLGVMSLACALALAGCDEELEEQVDGGEEPMELDDAGRPRPDAGQPADAHDAAVNDGGAPTQDAAAVNDASSAQDGALSQDASTDGSAQNSDAASS